jgi:hypothetical protein
MLTLNEAVTWGDLVVADGTTVTGAVLKATEAAGAVVPVNLTPGQTSVSLTLDTGIWTITVQAVDTLGAPVGPLVTDAVVYTVAGPVPVTITVQVPTALNGTLV